MIRRKKVEPRMKTALVERITVPVRPGELLFAMGVVEAVGDGGGTGMQAGAYRFYRGGTALI